MTLLELARQLDYLREAGPNMGQRVEGVQKWCGGQPGQSWCCYWVTFLLDIRDKGKSKIPRLGACEDVHQLAIKNGWLTDVPIPGDLVLSVTPEGHAHHIGIVCSVNPLTSIAGNTDPTGASSQGTGVFEHAISPAGKVFVRTP